MFVDSPSSVALERFLYLKDIYSNELEKMFCIDTSLPK